MTKIITLEKGNDGVYVSSGIAEEDTPKEEPKIFKMPEYEPPKAIKIKKKKTKQYTEGIEQIEVHRFIANHGDKAGEFLKGVETSVKAFNLLKKLMK